MSTPSRLAYSRRASGPLAALAQIEPKVKPDRGPSHWLA